MAVTSDNFENTITLVAPAGGATTGTLIYNATTKVVAYPLTTATSGSDYVAKVVGRLNGVAVESVAAMAAGTPLTYKTATSNFGPITTGTTGILNAWLAAPSVSTVLTGDVILCLPSGHPVA
jgi:hypothetical protein